jgi:PAS domain S-box-containing protein
MSVVERKKEILLIEDDRVFARTLMKAIESSNGHEFRISWSENLTEGLDRLSREAFDVLLLDLCLPESRGLETVSRAFAHAPQIPIVILSTFADEELTVGAMQAGAQDYLVKDQVERHLILRTLRMAIERRRHFSRLGSQVSGSSLLFSKNPLPMWVYDPKTLRFLEVNDAAVEKYGYSRAEFLGMTIAEIRPAEDVPALQETVRTSSESLHASGCWRHNRKDGRMMDVEIVSCGLPHAGRSARLVVAIDVTEQREAQKTANVQTSALQATANAIVITDRNAQIVWVNPAFTTLTGYSMEEVVGQTPRILKSGEHSPEFYAALWSTIGSGKIWRGEMTNRRKDGRLYVEEMTITPVRSAAGEITHFVAVKQDVTPQREAGKTQRRLAEILEATPDFVGLVDPAGCVLSVNRAGKAMMMLSDDTDVTSMRIEDLHPAWAFRLIQEQGIPAAIRQGSWSGETALLTADGQEIRVRQVIAAHFSDRGDLEYFSTIMHDVTVRIQALKALKESSERFRDLVNGLDAVVWEADPVNEKVLFVSQRAETILGYSLQRWYDEPDFWLKHIDPRDRARIEQFRAEKARSQESAFEVEYRMVAADGRTVWFRDRLTVKRDAQGRPVHLSGVMINITAQKRAQEELRLSIEKFQTIVETAQEGIWQVDAQGMTLYVNPRLEQILGHTAREMTGRSFLDFMDESQRASGRANLERRRRGVAETSETILLHRDGRKVHARLSTAPIFDELGFFQGAVAMVTDITDQKQAEEILRQSESKFRALTETVASAIFISQGDRFVYANHQTEVLLQCSREEILNRPFWDFLSPEHHELVRQRRAARLRGEDATSRYEIKIRTAKGEERWLDFSVSVVEYEGAPAILGTAFDITDRKVLEEQFRRAQKMEAVGQLSAGIAHDFNNILGVIIGFSELVQRRLHGDSDLYRQVEQIHKAGKRGAALTRQLLAFSRKQMLRPSVANLNSVVQDMSKSLLRLVGEHVEIVERLEAHLGSVRVDVTQMEQIILNLVVNARDAMPDGGILVLETGNVEFDTDQARRFVEMPAGRYVVLAVSDTGTGMSEEVKTRIFEPFFTTKEQGKGTGLGLATVYGIVKQSGGFIWVYSELGHGTTFKIYFPREDQAADDLRESNPATAEAGTETVLVVEDDVSLRHLTCEVLRGGGYQVLGSESPEDALRIVREYSGEIHLLLTDVIMPRMNGRAVAEQALALRENLRVLFVSGYNDDVALYKELFANGDNFLQKPFSREVLLRKVRELLDSDSRKQLPPERR